MLGDLPQIQENLDNGKTYSRFSNKWAVVILFLALMIIIPFFESKKVLMWDVQKEQGKFNPFHNTLIAYAVWAEALKQELNLNVIFEKENFFWQKVKGFPITPPKIIFNAGGLKNNEQSQPEQDKVFISVASDNSSTSLPSVIDVEPSLNIKKPYRFLLLGDSFMGTYAAVGDLLEASLLKYKDTAVYRFGKVSSGLSRPDFFDWNEKAEELIGLYNPNVVMVMMGTNDAQQLTLVDQKGKKTYLKFGTEEWKEEYGRRVEDFLKIFNDRNIIVFWVGLPSMCEPNYSERIKIIESIQEAQMNNFQNFSFISTWDLLSDDAGNYLAFLPDKNGQYRATRVSDGIHLTFFAGNIVLEKVLKQVDSKLSLEELLEQ